MNDPDLRQDEATVIGDHLRAVPPTGSSVDNVKIAFATAMLQTAKLAGETVQAAGAGMEERCPGRSRDRHDDHRETSTLETAEG